jgi:hypothetical protein
MDAKEQTCLGASLSQHEDEPTTNPIVFRRAWVIVCPAKVSRLTPQNTLRANFRGLAMHGLWSEKQTERFADRLKIAESLCGPSSENIRKQIQKEH